MATKRTSDIWDLGVWAVLNVCSFHRWKNILEASCYQFYTRHNAECFGHMSHAQLLGAPFTLYCIGIIVPILLMRKLRLELHKYLLRAKLELSS